MPAFNTPYQLSVARSLVRNLILERSADVGLVTDTELNDIINYSARTIWLRIATKYPDAFAQRSAASIPVTTNSIPFSSIAAGGAVAGNVFRILNALVGPTGTAENAMEQIHEFDKVASRHVYEPGVGGTPTGLVAQPSLPYRWYVEGQTLYFTPQTKGSFDARIQFVQQPQDMTIDTDTIWQGQLAMYNDTVCSFAAVTAETKDGQPSPAATTLFAVLDQSLVEAYGLPRYPIHDAPINPYAENSKNARP